MNKDKTSTEVALSAPTVNSNINMNLNQNDMIDVVIEHQIEHYQNELVIINEREVIVRAELKACTDRYLELVFEQYTASNSDYNNFLKIVKQNKLVSVRNLTCNNVNYGTQIKIGEFKTCDIDTMEQYKDPYNYAKRHTYKTDYNLVTLNDVTISFKATSGPLDVQFFMKGNIVSESIKEQCLEAEKKIVKELLKILTKKYELSMSYLEYKYGEKKIKAKIVKASLAKSAEGRGILAMLEGATNIKLLG